VAIRASRKSSLPSRPRISECPSNRRHKAKVVPSGKAAGLRWFRCSLFRDNVTFRYKKDVDVERTPQFGVVAEQVEAVDPDLVTRDPDGKTFTVRYEAVNAMLLNEFLKEHWRVEEQSRKIQEQDATIMDLKSIAAKQETINAQQQREIKTLAATLREQASQIQKVSAQFQLEKASAQTMVNNQ
jgi:hypothetical protein